MRLRLTDGTTTLTSGTDFELRRYTPQAPQLDTQEAARAGADGAEVYGATYRNVTESAAIYLDADDEYAGGVVANARSTLATIHRMFEQARHRQRTGMGARVWVEHQVEDGDDWYRSELLAGRVVMDDAKLRYGLQLLGEHIELVLLWTRRFFWEYAATAAGVTDALEVPLNGATGGAAITNDAGNTLDIDAADVVGDLPAPLRLEVTNTDASAARHYTIYVAHNVYSEPGDFAHHLAGGSTSTGSGSEVLLYTWSLTTAMLEDLAGNIARLMMLMSSVWPNTLWLRWAVYWSLTRLWESGWMQQTGQGLKDLAAAPLPPKLVEGAGVAPSALELRLYGRGATGVPYTITWLQIVPVDSWRVLQPVGYGLAQNTRVVDDAITGQVWSDGWGAGTYTPHYTARGNPIMVRPGLDQRLYVLVNTDTGTSVDGRTSTVRAYYRPRRLLL